MMMEDEDQIDLMEGESEGEEDEEGEDQENEEDIEIDPDQYLDQDQMMMLEMEGEGDLDDSMGESSEEEQDQEELFDEPPANEDVLDQRDERFEQILQMVGDRRGEDDPLDFEQILNRAMQMGRPGQPPRPVRPARMNDPFAPPPRNLRVSPYRPAQANAFSRAPIDYYGGR